MLLLLRRLLVALTIVAFGGGMTIQAMPSAAALGFPTSSQADAACPHMATHDPGTQKPLPTRGMDADCLKQMGCLGMASLPIRPGEPAAPVTYSKVIYSVPSTPRDGASVKPELLPPIRP
jgi:hypothetical protein